DGDAVAASVTPMPSRTRAEPRSTVTLPVHCVAHHAVEALPSTAFEAGAPLPAEVAVAPAPMARFTLWAGPVDGVPASDEASEPPVVAPHHVPWWVLEVVFTHELEPELAWDRVGGRIGDGRVGVDVAALALRACFGDDGRDGGSRDAPALELR